MARKIRTKEQKLLDLSRARIDALVWLTYDILDPSVILSGAPPDEVQWLLDDIGIVRRWFDELAEHAASITEAA
jgi:hypothetical protein